MFGISGFELLIIAAFVLVIFGPDKLPELAKTIGRAMNMFKSAQQDMERVIRAEMFAEQGVTPLDNESSEAAAAAAAATNVWSATAEDEDEEEEE